MNFLVDLTVENNYGKEKRHKKFFFHTYTPTCPIFCHV